MNRPIAIVINVPQATDRLQHIDKLFTHFGINYIIENANAIDDLSEDVLTRFGSPTDPTTQRAIACTQSHVSAWRTFLSTDNEECMIAEDDILLCRNFDTIWNNLDIPDDSFAIWKIETMNATCTIQRRCERQYNGFSFHQLHSGHAGAAAYIINRKTAKFLLSVANDFRAIIDNELFDPILCNVPMCRTYQAIPALCIQDSENSNSSTTFHSIIGPGRNPDASSKINQLRRKYLSPLVTALVSCLISYQGLRRVKVKHLPLEDKL